MSEEVLANVEPKSLLFDKGLRRYLAHCLRPAVVGGPKPATPKRYKPIFNKAITHFHTLGLTTWNQVTKHHLESYAAWLDGEGYAYGTEFMETTTLKQALGFFIREGLIPAGNKILLPMKKPTDSDTYCYTVSQVKAMLSLCRSCPGLTWLADVILALATTGMRISELSSLNWEAVDLDHNVLLLKDELRRRIAKRRAARTTKSGRDRMFPIHPQLRDLLVQISDQGKKGAVFHAAKGRMLLANNVRESLVTRVITPLSGRFPSEEDEIGSKMGDYIPYGTFSVQSALIRACPNR